MGQFAVPVGGKEILGTVIVHGHAGPQAHVLHETVGAYSLQLSDKPFSDVIEHRVVVPHIRQAVGSRFAEHQVGNRLADTAKGILAVSQHPDNAEDAAAAVRLGEDPARGRKAVGWE